MISSLLFAAAAPGAGAASNHQSEMGYIWDQTTGEARVVLVLLFIFSMVSWMTVLFKVLQMRRAKKLNQFFNAEFRVQTGILGIYDRKVQVEGCPLFTVYQEGSVELDSRLKNNGPVRNAKVSLTSMEYVKRALERTVAQESLKLESGLILLALAVSGAPFLGLLGTVWGVMQTFSHIGMVGRADLATMAPGVSGALICTVAGLVVAIPAMFGYNWLVHNLRVLTVELDNFAQELVSKMEGEYLRDDEHRPG